jgi:hypothetical protein
VPTGPFAQSSVLRPEVQRFLRMATSWEMRGHPRASIAALSVMTGVDRKGLHAIILRAGAVRAGTATNRTAG